MTNLGVKLNKDKAKATDLNPAVMRGMAGRTGFKKTIALIMLFMIVGMMAIGCSSSSGESLTDQHAISGGNEDGDNVETVGISNNGDYSDLPPLNDSESTDSASGQSDKHDVDGNKDQGNHQVGLGNQKSASAPEQNAGKAENALKCTFSINCGTIFDNLNKIDSAIVETLPRDGWIYKAKEVEFTEGESVFDILLRITRQEKIHMESNSNPALKSKYVEGIHNLYEFDAGELSGWTYKINGEGMGYGSSSSYPVDGDKIEWIYTCDQGRDIGVTAR